MKFSAKTDEEINESGLLADGIYKAKVMAAFDHDKDGNHLLTKNGDEKINLVCGVYDLNGKERTVKCTLTGAYPKLLKHFCNVNGLKSEYTSENLTAKDCTEKTKNFVVEIGRQTFTRQDTGQDMTVNCIKDFLPYKETEQQKQESELNDDIPF